MGRSLGSLGDFLGDKLNSIVTSIKSLSTSLGNWFRDLGSKISDLSVSIGGWFSDLMSDLGSSFSNLFDNLGSWFGNLFETLKSILNWLLDFGKWLLDFIKNIFIPSEDYFKEKNNQVKNTLNKKFGWVEVFYNQQKVNVEDVFSGGYSIPFINGTKISFDWYMPYRIYIKGILATVFSILISLAVIKRLRVKVQLNG